MENFAETETKKVTKTYKRKVPGTDPTSEITFVKRIFSCLYKNLCKLFEDNRVDLGVKQSDVDKICCVLCVQLIDHVTTGIEDITGYQGHNGLRERSVTVSL